MDTQTVVAQDAPLGVQLWPTRGPEFADAFTLTRVEVARTESCPGGYVRWIYRNGNVRLFAVGERVAVKYPEGYTALDVEESQ